MMVNLYIKTGRERDNELLHLCEHFEQDNTQLKIALTDTKSQLTDEIENRKALEMRMQDELERDPSHRYNPQTGIYTEKAMMEMIGQEISRTRRYQRPLSLLCIRVDALYAVVEKASLTPGKLLAMLSDTFSGTLRREDVLGHCGNDGFYVLLPETGRYASYVVAERLRHLVEVMSLFDVEEGASLTISIGLTASQDQAKMTAELFTEQSKVALAAAEEHGGNWSISWHDLSHSPS
jgi:diguanylate cyclase (GGDEF)-like protein